MFRNSTYFVLLLLIGLLGHVVLSLHLAKRIPRGEGELLILPGESECALIFREGEAPALVVNFPPKICREIDSSLLRALSDESRPAMALFTSTLPRDSAGFSALSDRIHFSHLAWPRDAREVLSEIPGLAPYIDRNQPVRGPLADGEILPVGPLGSGMLFSTGRDGHGLLYQCGSFRVLFLDLFGSKERQCWPPEKLKKIIPGGILILEGRVADPDNFVKTITAGSSPSLVLFRGGHAFPISSKRENTTILNADQLKKVGLTFSFASPGSRAVMLHRRFP